MSPGGREGRGGEGSEVREERSGLGWAALEGRFQRARLQSLPLVECMAAGARASAVTVSRLGAQQSIPTRAEVEHKFGLDGLDGEAE